MFFLTPSCFTAFQLMERYKAQISLLAALKPFALSEYIVLGVPRRAQRSLKASMNASVPALSTSSRWTALE